MWVKLLPFLWVRWLTLVIYDLQNAILGSTRLLHQALDAGIKRFSFLSSIGATVDLPNLMNLTRIAEDGGEIFTLRVSSNSL